MPTTEIKTDPKLLARLSAAVHTKISREQLRRQRVSFIYGNLPSDSSITRDQVECALEKLEG